MSKLDQMIKKYCPNGVKFVTLGELNSAKGDLFRGIRICKRDLLTNGKYNVYGGGGEIIFGKYNNFNVEPGTVTVNVAGSVGFVDYIYDRAWIVDSRYAFLSKKIVSKFLFYVLKDKQKILESFKKGAIPGINMSKLLSIKIPIPPLQIQNEIVKILDNFEACEKSLKNELAVRIKQYKYYETLLLSNNDLSKPVLLKNICNFQNGVGHEKNVDMNGKFYIVNSKFISTNGKIFKKTATQLCPVFKNDVLIVMSDLPYGKALAKCFFVNQNDLFTLNQRVGRLTVNKAGILPKYVFYVMNRNKQLLRYDNHVDQTNLKKENILNVKISIPCLEKQEKIVKILDTFNNAFFFSTIGLPKEIELRHKQYEYYRNKLLTFKELKV